MIGYAGVLAFALMSSRADTVQNAVAKAAVP
jgi:hypothetical protein